MFVEGIKFANELRLRWQNYSGLAVCLEQSQGCLRVDVEGTKEGGLMQYEKVSTCFGWLRRWKEAINPGSKAT